MRERGRWRVAAAGLARFWSACAGHGNDLDQPTVELELEQRSIMIDYQRKPVYISREAG